MAALTFDAFLGLKWKKWGLWKKNGDQKTNVGAVQQNIIENYLKELIVRLSFLYTLPRLIMKTPDQGGDTLVAAALNPDFDDAKVRPI